MTLPASGPISFNDINVELGVSGTTQASLGQASYRTLAGVPSGAISMSNFYGKANEFTATISSNQTNLNLATWASANGWNGTSKATITIGSGIWIYSTSTGTPALTTGNFPNGLTIVNNGYIAGKGGDAGTSLNVTGGAGGNAISLGCSVTIDNTNGAAYIGGGGGAAGNTYYSPTNLQAGGGGGAGGGSGGLSGYGGAGGGVGASGANGSRSVTTASTQFGLGGGSGGGGGTSYSGFAGGGGGGRIFPGSGGAGGYVSAIQYGGNGGSANAAGSNGRLVGSSNTQRTSGGGGGWGASAGNGNINASTSVLGGSGGKSVALNGYSVTWTSGITSRVYGGIS